jgi:adenylate cyclase
MGMPISRLGKALLLGCIVALCGLIVTLLPVGSYLEEDIGLDILFKLRGARKAPKEVVVVAIDKSSADNLNLSERPERWPRSFHATLVENLVKAQASVIVFDVSFLEPGSARDDRIFAESLRKAKTVVLCECLKVEKIALGGDEGEVDVIKEVLPTDQLSHAAAATAPFALPRTPVKLNQYWTFKSAAGDKPTVPVVAFQLFTMPVYDTFVSLLSRVNPHEFEQLPKSAEAVISSRRVAQVIHSIREIFEDDKEIAGRMTAELERIRPLLGSQSEYRMLKSLIRLYQSAQDSQYLNFYGPPLTIETIPYHEIINMQNRDTAEERFNLKGKAVFIGQAAFSPAEQGESFYTVFSREEGWDISGVEIAATAFANLFEGATVRPLPAVNRIVLIALYGMILGILCRYIPGHISPFVVAGLSAGYLLTAVTFFEINGMWLPVVIPVFFQPTLSIFGNAIWRYFETKTEQQKISETFGYYLPADVVSEVVKGIEKIKASEKFVYGICLSTDAEHYTSLAEKMQPNRLKEFMNKYYGTIFEPVRKHGGNVSNVIGDSMLAIWVKQEQADSVMCNGACRAAFDIASALDDFNRSSNEVKLPTRIGIHAGEIAIGSIGAFDHYEYRPLGDTVNTTTRVEGLNKYLGTRILATWEVVAKGHDVLTRKVGKFLLKGKRNPTTVFELICRNEEATEQQRSLSILFEEALDDFKRRDWNQAILKFSDVDQRSGGDGPSQFYIRLCEKFRENPPAEDWKGEVLMERK